MLTASISGSVIEPDPQLAGRWSAERANNWYEQHSWLVGCNYIPSTAINQLEMWQPETFDPVRIDIELGWAEGLGFNTVRVFLHHLQQLLQLTHRLRADEMPAGLEVYIFQHYSIARFHVLQPCVLAAFFRRPYSLANNCYFYSAV